MTPTRDHREPGETERALARYRLLAEHASDMMLFVRPDGRIAEANRAALQSYGYTREEMLGLTVFDLREPAEHPLVGGQLEQATAGGITFETRHRRKDGSTFPVEVSSQSAEMGGERLIFSVVRDVSERRRAEHALRESEERFRTIANAAPALIWISDKENRCTWFNRPWLAFTGRALEDEVGEGWMEGVHPADLERYNRADREAFERRVGVSQEFRLRRHDGEYRWILEQGEPIHGPGGEFVGFAGSCVDITDRRLAEEALRQRDEQLQMALDAATMGVWIWEIPTGRIEWSPECYRVFGVTGHDGSVESFTRMVHPDDVARLWARVEEALRTDGAYDCEFRILRGDGAVRWIANRGRGEYDAEGRPVRMVGIAMDVSERKQAEEELQRHTAVLDAVTSSTPDPVFVKDRGGRILMANPATLEALGLPAEQVIGSEGTAHFSPQLRDQLAANDREVLETGVAQVYEETLPGGRTFLSTKSPYRDPGGSIIGLIGISRDITERKRVESRRTLLLEISRLVLESPEAGPQLTAAIFEKIRGPLEADACFNYRLENGALRLETCLGVPPELVASAERLELNQAFCGTVAASCTPIMADARRIETDPKGSFVRGVEATAYACHPLFDGQGRVLGTFSVASRHRTAFSTDDVDFLQTLCHFLALAWERREASAALRRNEAQLRLALAASRAGIWAWDIAGGAMSWSPETFLLYGYDPARGPASYADWEARIHPDDRGRTLQAVRDAVEGRTAEYRAEFRIVHPERGVRWLMASGRVDRAVDGTPLRLSGINLDITDRRETESRLHQAQRVQSVGRLAGGIAHEVNNLMTVVLGFGNFAIDQLEPAHAARGEIDQMIKAGERAAAITRQLLAFTRQQVLRPARLDLNAVVRDLVPMFERMLGAEHRLRLELGEGLGTVAADRSQLEQVLVNLTLNSRDAMDRAGTVTIATAAADLEDDAAWRHPGAALRRGRYLLLTVSDSGAGMDEATRSRVFEPFFTTKPVGQGTGLGLSTVYGIVKQSGGYVWLYSEPGLGTTAKVYLPMLAETESVAGPADRVARTRRAEGEVVLIAEDEPLVRRLAVRSLEMHGYRVLEAGDGRAALDLLEQVGGVDLVLSDAVMPQMNGRTLGEIAASRWPDLPVLYMSGYPGTEVVDRGLVHPDAPFIAKPFTPEALAHRVREVLDRARR